MNMNLTKMLVPFAEVLDMNIVIHDLLVPYVNVVGKNATFAMAVFVGMVKVMKHVMFAEVII